MPFDFNYMRRLWGGNRISDKSISPDKLEVIWAVLGCTGLIDDPVFQKACDFRCARFKFLLPMLTWN